MLGRAPWTLLGRLRPVSLHRAFGLDGLDRAAFLDGRVVLHEDFAPLHLLADLLFSGRAHMLLEHDQPAVAEVLLDDRRVMAAILLLAGPPRACGGLLLEAMALELKHVAGLGVLKLDWVPHL